MVDEEVFEARLRRLEARVVKLENDLRARDKMRAGESFDDASAATPPARPTSVLGVRSAAPAATSAATSASSVAAPATTAPSSAVAPAAAQATPFAPAKPPSRPPSLSPRAPLAERLEPHWLARAGIVILALGVIFFLASSLAPSAVRYFGGITFGVLLFGGGVLLTRKQLDPSFAQVLEGGGILIAYTAVYAGYAVTAMRLDLGLTAALTATLLAAIAAWAAVHAVINDRQVVAAIAALLAGVLMLPAGDFTPLGAVYAGAISLALILAADQKRWANVLTLAVVVANLGAAATAWLGDAAIPAVIGLVIVDAVAIWVSVRRDWPTRAGGTLIAANLVIITMPLVASLGWTPIAIILTLLNGVALVGLATTRAQGASAVATAGAAVALSIASLDGAAPALTIALMTLLAAVALGTQQWRAARGASAPPNPISSLVAVGALYAVVTISLLSVDAERAGIALGLGLVGAALVLAAIPARVERLLLAVNGAIGIGLASQTAFESVAATTLTQAFIAAGILVVNHVLERRMRGLDHAAVAFGGLALLQYVNAVAFELADGSDLRLTLTALLVVGAGVALALRQSSGAGSQQSPGAGSHDVHARLGLAGATAALLAYLLLILPAGLVAISWGVTALVLLGLGASFEHADLRTAAQVTFALGIARLVIFDWVNLGLGARILAFVLTGALLLGGAYVFARRNRPDAADETASIASAEAPR